LVTGPEMYNPAQCASSILPLGVSKPTLCVLLTIDKQLS
jgi:hypothetical protein